MERTILASVRLGVQIEPQFGYAYEDVLAIARDAERLGVEALFVSDHLFLGPDAARTNCLEAWSLLAALARETSTLRLGPLVTSVSYRNPALLAKIAAGVDAMSGGRLEFGIGAGWKEVEYRAYGYDFPPPFVRIEQMVDAIEICLRMWTEERATYHGKHFRIDDALCAPKPARKPRVWIGGARRRMFHVMARYADVVNIGGFPTLETYVRAMADLDDACRGVGRDPATLVRTHFSPCVVAPDGTALAALLDELAARAKTNREEWRKARPSTIVGTPEEVAERLRAFATAGCAMFIPVFPYGREREMLPLLARIAPAIP